MSESDVTRDGIRGARPDRDALVGKGMENGERRRRKGGKGRKGDQSMVPRAEFTSYYGRPVLNPPTWSARDVAGYLFLGGLAGAGSVLAAGAELTGRPVMARALKVSSVAALAGSTAALIHDLGRPERFANMLRVFKPTSPMSVGSWLLMVYGPIAGAAAASDLAGRLPRAGRAATVGAGLLGPAVASYTAVLAANTAVPAWHDGYREMPFVFIGSAATAASGMALLVSPVAENAPARGVAVLGTALETAAVKAMERRVGVVAETYREGRAGRLMRAAEALSAAGALGGALLGRRNRTAAALSGAALLAASVCTRFGVFHAGIRSAEDPKYTVLPQRERLDARRERPDAQRDRPQDG
ncbi:MULTISPECIES: NrfD/PsrC family molybdoenzyme membrane anchor subunit [Streptomyces]|uniref:Formate-dependent nitrite reductase, membrane component NrfD n=1 Tax=Streptomyces melanosporofaciens TaxID=67327 RepID=A0A1H4YBS7_STRMJ|nr:NrfD/PsrC family molybdoenzyme membrane anchor subunit [Streptomyces melanosporofaciens]SED14464.1 Formate-dependent nitrite reductase, membrane component NrfD [Streptomyces melanosporofaciens]